ncbi:MAG: hypothetical protein U9N02_06825 [Campylobacterota bacterium]|nr:hypothetical protein [Campylobacterota bacterium]
MYSVNLISEAHQDLLVLPENILKEVIDYFYKFEKDPYKYSSKLHNQGGLNLEGYRKTYVAEATYRIVFQIENGVTKIVEVIAVGKRDNKEVYSEAFDRIK